MGVRENGERWDVFKSIIQHSFFILVVTSCTFKEVQPVQVPPPVPPPPKPAKIGLVLGAGLSKGFAHIGALKILESNKIPIHMIVGTSVGSAACIQNLLPYSFPRPMW